MNNWGKVQNKKLVKNSFASELSAPADMSININISIDRHT